MEKKPGTPSKASAKSASIEAHVMEQQRRKEEVQLLEELGKRIHIAREARTLFENDKLSESLIQYRKFLSLTARGLKVEVSALDPKLFDDKSRAQESLLLSSALLDLAKILDKINNESANKERTECFRLYIKFVKDQPFQGHAAVNLRRYIEYTGSIKNKRQFWSVYNTIKVKKFCIVATAVYDTDNNYELVILRQFRDQSLGASAIGRYLINFYYNHGHHLLWPVKRFPGCKLVIRRTLSFLCRIL